MRIVNVVGARPNFMKMSPLLREMRRHPDIVATLVHTGQHYDEAMAGQIFRDLGLVLKEVQPWLVVVVGDVNSTLAAAVTA